MPVTWDQLELPWDEVGPTIACTAAARATLATFSECPLCGGDLLPEHAHYKCAACGWRDSCCD